METLDLTSADGVRLKTVVHLSASASSATVVLAHGIAAEKDEGGMYVRLADRLAEAGLTAVRFDFRGHGESGGTPQGVTIAGEMLDLQCVIDVALAQRPAPLTIVAASFGAVATSLSLPNLALRGLVLWNPVLDLEHTFLDPVLPWGIANFGPAQQERLRREGYLLVDGEFALGRVLFEEMRHYRPTDYFAADRTPALVVHGDRDTYVSYDIAETAARAHASCDFHSVRGSDHGFDTREHEDEAIDVTVAWITRRHRGSA